MNVFDLVEQWQEVWELLRQQFFHRPLRIDGEAKDFRQDVSFGKSNLLRIDAGACYDGIDQVFLIFAIHDGEPAGVAERAAVTAQHAISNGMKCAAPKPAGINR